MKSRKINFKTIIPQIIIDSVDDAHMHSCFYAFPFLQHNVAVREL